MRAPLQNILNAVIVGALAKASFSDTQNSNAFS